MIHKPSGGNRLSMVGIRNIRSMSVLQTKGVILSYAFTTANVHDSKMAPVLFQYIQDRNVLFSVADATYDSQHIYGVSQTYNIVAVNPTHPRNVEQIKSTQPRVLSLFTQAIFDKQLMKERRKIEQQFRNFKHKGLEQSHLFGINWY